MRKSLGTFTATNTILEIEEDERIGRPHELLEDFVKTAKSRGIQLFECERGRGGMGQSAWSREGVKDGITEKARDFVLDNNRKRKEHYSASRLVFPESRNIEEIISEGKKLKIHQLNSFADGIIKMTDLLYRGYFEKALSESFTKKVTVIAFLKEKFDGEDSDKDASVILSVEMTKEKGLILDIKECSSTCEENTGILVSFK